MMKKFQLYAMGLALLLAPLFQSCLDDEDNSGGYSLAIANVKMINEKEFYFELDSKRTLLPINTGISSAFLKEDKRVLVNFSTLQSDLEGYDAKIRINDIDSVLTKKVIPLSKEDSIGDNRARMSDIWIGGKYLNIYFLLPGSYHGPRHMVNLAYSLKETALPEDGYYPLEFRHNAMGDDEVSWYWGIASFNIESYLSDKSIKGLSIRFKTSYNEEKTYKIAFDEKDRPESSMLKSGHNVSGIQIR